jgi:hypothetical protein
MNCLLLLKYIGLLIFINLAAGCTQSGSSPLPAEVPDWENQQMIQRNRQPAHATLIPYPNEASARNCNPETSPNRIQRCIVGYDSRSFQLGDAWLRHTYLYKLAISI